MRRLHRIDRRMFLTEVGRGTLAVAVLGTAVVACGDDDDDTSAPSTTGEPESSTTSEPREADDGADDAGEWHRVSFGFVSAYVLIRGRESAVVDTGTAGGGGQIREALVAGGADWDSVRHVILTHHHPDHVGSVGEVLDNATEATAYAGEADIASIESPRPVQAVGDGDDVFGLRIIATPGHTAGHVSVLDPEASYLVAGDALTGEEGSGVSGSNPEFTADEQAAAASVRKLAELDFDIAVFGHGEPLDADAAAAVAELAASL